MPKFDLTRALRIKDAGGEMAALKGSSFSWQRPPLTDFYGIGAGKIAIHLNPEMAEEDGGAVIRVPNSGGAGALFDAGASAGVTKVANYLSLSNANDLKLANPADIQGVRLFLPSYRTVTQQAYFMGALGEINTNVRYTHTGTAETTIIFNASNGGISPSAGAIPRGIGIWQLVEIEVSDASTRIWCNGIEVTAGGGRSMPYPIQQIGRHPDMVTGPIWTGRIGDILGVTLGAGDAEAISAARAYLAAKFGIPLP